LSLNTRLLRQARALATHRRFSRAAEVLGVSQPTLSRGIQDLERSLGVSLFNRTGTGVEPTDFGWVFLEQATDILERLEDLERESRLVRGLQKGRVSVGMGPYAAQSLLPAAAGAFISQHPGVRLSVRVGAWDAQARWLRAREVGLTVAEVSPTGLEGDLEAVDRLPPLKGFVVARAGHPLCSRRNLRLADTFHYPFAVVGRLPPRILQPLLDARRASAARPGEPADFPTIECPSADLARGIVSRSDALTLATLDTVKSDIEEGRLVPLLHEPWLHTAWTILRLRRRTLSPAAQAFVEALREAQAEAAKLETRFLGRGSRRTGRRKPATSASGRSAGARDPTSGTGA
jgi:DNA-binding transcriptional LysR family regulator